MASYIAKVTFGITQVLAVLGPTLFTLYRSDLPNAITSESTYMYTDDTTIYCVKAATHLAILYADRRDRRKSPGVPGAVMAIFADRRNTQYVAILEEEKWDTTHKLDIARGQGKEYLVDM